MLIPAAITENRFVRMTAGRTGRLLTAMLACLLFGPTACSRPVVSAKTSQEPEAAIRYVRVRVAAGEPRIRLRADQPLSLVSAGGQERQTITSGEWTVLAASPTGGIRCGERRWDVVGVTAATVAPDTIALSVDDGGRWSPVSNYPGYVSISLRDDGLLDVVNHVGVEAYVASVVAHEVWPTFEREAYRALAVAARTYVLYQMTRRNQAAYDVVATQAAQVYRGDRTDEVGRRASAAAGFTRGVVCTWRHDGRDYLFSAFYSAVCGGLTQSGAIMGREHAIEPLAGGVVCDYCANAPGDTYRWGPIQLDKQAVRSRLVARSERLALLGRITAIDVVERSPQHRPTKLRITDANGSQFEVSAELFRLAAGAEKMKSTDCKIRVTARHIVLSDGRGFGHGVGLCQWGTQGLARLGHGATDILRFYYPGIRLVRAY